MSNILVWLPSPMGDAIMSTPALRAIRENFKNDKIFFLASPLIRQVLSPSRFADEWIEYEGHNILAIGLKLKKYRFSFAILLKNSFTPALAAFISRIPVRAGYNRSGRGFLLTEKLSCIKNADGKFKPVPMIDYYLAFASFAGSEWKSKEMELAIDEKAKQQVQNKFPQLSSEKPVVILVPGGAYGSAKCWPGERFAETADRLIEKYDATVFVSVGPAEIKIAEQICKKARHNLINSAQKPLSLGQLKALFSCADLIITNDTGPRHIGLALGIKTISLFGPNDPEWTRCQCENETQIIADVSCAPCDKGRCPLGERICMESITVEKVCSEAVKILGEK